MKRIALLLTCLLASTALADTFVERWRKRVAVFERENATLAKDAPTVVLLGSSSMHGWENGNRTRFLPEGFTFLNRGIGGDGIGISDVTGIKNRLQASVFDAGAPTHVFLLNGRNSIGRDGSRVEQTAAVYREVIEAIQARLPNTTVCVVTCAPVNKGYKVMAPHVVTFNRLIKSIAADRRCPVIDLHAKLVADDGETMPLSLTSDGLHFNNDGYKLLADEIARVLREHPAGQPDGGDAPTPSPTKGMKSLLPR